MNFSIKKYFFCITLALTIIFIIGLMWSNYQLKRDYYNVEMINLRQTIRISILEMEVVNCNHGVRPLGAVANVEQR